MSKKLAPPPWLQDANTPAQNQPINQPINVNTARPTQISSSQQQQQQQYIDPESQQRVLSLTDEEKRKKYYLYWILKIGTIALSLLMFFTSIIGINSIDGLDNSGKIFVGTYMLFFSLLLFIFESIQILPHSSMQENLDHMFRRNFGFLYNVMGKSFFIIFIAFLSFGLGEPMGLTIGTGVSLAIFGACELGIYLQFPELF
jgi:hypothetical protein